MTAEYSGNMTSELHFSHVRAKFVLIRAIRVTASAFRIADPNSSPYLFDVSPEAATEMQIECYRQMTCEERIGVALRLHELSCEMARVGIRHQHPGATEEEVNRLLQQRLELA